MACCNNILGVRYCLCRGRYIYWSEHVMNQLGNFPYKHALVLGLAKSGAAAANTLLRNGIKVTINDYRTEKDAPIVNEFTKLGAEVIVGSHPLSVLDGVDIIVKNPGISYDNIILSAAENLYIPIITEIELAPLLLEEHDIIGITGSNGKTTTTSLGHQMLVESKQSVKLARNIGIVATEVAETLEKDERSEERRVGKECRYRRRRRQKKRKAENA